MGRRKRRSTVHGWLLLDKPEGLSSNAAVSRIKRIFDCPKAGHAGTLDPLASGMLPVALGEATKTVPYVMDGEKTYEFEVLWGAATSTDDLEGEVIARSEHRPTAEEIDIVLPAFTGAVEQTPPKFSAIKIDGKRAYDLARKGSDVDMPSRTVTIHDLVRLGSAKGAQTRTRFRCDCGKGTYIRAIARDIGESLGCFGHVSKLRRTRVGNFDAGQMVALAALEDVEEAHAILLPAETGLHGLPAINVSEREAADLKLGRTVLLRDERGETELELATIMYGSTLVALGTVAASMLSPKRIFHIGE